MQIEIKKSFLKDLKKIEKNYQLKAIELIDKFENSEILEDISNIKKLKGCTNFFRVRIFDYRVGIVFEDNIVKFVRFLHRKDIYKFFP